MFVQISFQSLISRSSTSERRLLISVARGQSQIFSLNSFQMNCLCSLQRSAFWLPQRVGGAGGMKSTPSSVNVGVKITSIHFQKRMVSIKAASGSKSNVEVDDSEVEEEKSDVYSNTMTEAMGAVLTYRHELGMNYNFIRPDLIVGSCLQTPEDVDKLRKIGVKTVFCLQQNPDLDYFGVDINAIQNYAKTFTDIQHIRAEIRDFDAFDLRMRLPAVLSKLYKAINENGGVTYIHCTAGLGRAPAVALAYMFWVQGYKLSAAHSLLQSIRSCFPKLEAIKSATADILTGLRRKYVTLTWKGNASISVEISGLDIGWGQKMSLKYEQEQGFWILERELLEGRYEYKYIIDGEWIVNKDELITTPNKDGHVNNYIQVVNDERTTSSAALRTRLMGDDPDLTKDERVQIREFLDAFSDEE